MKCGGFLSLSLMIICSANLSRGLSDANDAEIESALAKIFSPDQSSMHLRALRNDLLRRLYNSLNEDRNEDYLKRSMNSLARWDNLPSKRNLAALAKGGYIRTIPDEENQQQQEEEDKRSLASLVKNGQLPMNSEDPKRSFYSWQQKRYLGSLARSGQIKRNLASLARDGYYNGGKRNVAALLRQVKMHPGPELGLVDGRDEDKQSTREDSDDTKGDNKRNIGSIKAQQQIKPNYYRFKRELGYDEEYAPIYQNQNDYEDLLKALSGEYIPEKRFLGSVAKTGWFRPSERVIEKRHIGSLARLGWLPSLRMVRRFNRSGRTALDYDDECDCSRASAADGQTEDNAIYENHLPVDNKRYLVQPMIDKLLLEKLILSKGGTNAN